MPLIALECCTARATRTHNCRQLNKDKTHGCAKSRRKLTATLRHLSAGMPMACCPVSILLVISSWKPAKLKLATHAMRMPCSIITSCRNHALCSAELISAHMTMEQCRLEITPPMLLLLFCPRRCCCVCCAITLPVCSVQCQFVLITASNAVSESGTNSGNAANDQAMIECMLQLCSNNKI